MDFIYDSNGRPYAMVSGDSTVSAVYYYVLNQQGDVIRVVSRTGATVATYAYNAWGEVIASSGWMANINPIRYRGYFQDNETGFYYLQSRYYDPSIGRFINADEYASTGQGFLGYNMFTYCANNPITYIDESGDRIRLTDAGTGRKSPYTKNVSTKTAKKKPVKVGKVILEAIEKPSKNGGTFSVGPSFSGSSYGMGVGKSACLSVDTGYNYVIQSTTSTSPPSSPGASAGLTFTFTDAMNVSDLEGMSFSRGVTLVAKYGISIDYVTFEPASNPGTTNHGIAVTIGVGADVGFQAAENDTVTHGSWNPITAIKNAIYGG